jgi:hypothetical protein
MKPALLVAGLAAFVATAPTSSSISTDTKVEVPAACELSTPSNILSLISVANEADLSSLPPPGLVEALTTREDSLVTAAAAAGYITLCSEHKKQGECKTFAMGTSGICVRFDGMYMRAKSFLQPQGSACLYWSHDDCEEGGGPATALIDIYYFDREQNWSTLYPYEGLFASGKCHGPDQSRKARGFALKEDVRSGNIV